MCGYFWIGRPYITKYLTKYITKSSINWQIVRTVAQNRLRTYSQKDQIHNDEYFVRSYIQHINFKVSLPDRVISADLTTKYPKHTMNISGGTSPFNAQNVTIKIQELKVQKVSNWIFVFHKASWSFFVFFLSLEMLGTMNVALTPCGALHDYTWLWFRGENNHPRIIY